MLHCTQIRRPAGRRATRSLVTFDCQSCGACCYGPDEYVAVTERDLCRMSKHIAARYVVRRKERVFLKMVHGRCAALHARQGHFSCRIYGARPNVCHVVAAGSRECLEARGRRGVSDGP
jgi:Fe-S-cluster containining protein